MERNTNLTNIASGLGNNSHSDFFFGDGEVDQSGFEYEPLSNMQNGQVRGISYKLIAIALIFQVTHLFNLKTKVFMQMYYAFIRKHI